MGSKSKSKSKNRSKKQAKPAPKTSGGEVQSKPETNSSNDVSTVAEPLAEHRSEADYELGSVSTNVTKDSQNGAKLSAKEENSTSTYVGDRVESNVNPTHALGLQQVAEKQVEKPEEESIKTDTEATAEKSLQVEVKAVPDSNIHSEVKPAFQSQEVISETSAKLIKNNAVESEVSSEIASETHLKLKESKNEPGDSPSTEQLPKSEEALPISEFNSNNEIDATSKSQTEQVSEKNEDMLGEDNFDELKAPVIEEAKAKSATAIDDDFKPISDSVSEPITEKIDESLSKTIIKTEDANEISGNSLSKLEQGGDEDASIKKHVHTQTVTHSDNNLTPETETTLEPAEDNRNAEDEDFVEDDDFYASLKAEETEIPAAANVEKTFSQENNNENLESQGEDDDDFYQNLNTSTKEQEEPDQVLSSPSVLGASTHEIEGVSEQDLDNEIHDETNPESNSSNWPIVDQLDEEVANNDFYQGLSSEDTVQIYEEKAEDHSNNNEQIPDVTEEIHEETGEVGAPKIATFDLNLDDDSDFLDDDDNDDSFFNEINASQKDDVQQVTQQQIEVDQVPQQDVSLGLSFLDSDEDLLPEVNEDEPETESVVESLPLRESKPQPFAPAMETQTIKPRPSMTEFHTEQKSFDLPLEILPQQRPRHHAPRVISRTGTPKSHEVPTHPPITPRSVSYNLPTSAQVSPRSVVPPRPSQPTRAARSQSGVSGSKYTPVPGSAPVNVAPPPPSTSSPSQLHQQIVTPVSNSVDPPVHSDAGLPQTQANPLQGTQPAPTAGDLRAASNPDPFGFPGLASAPPKRAARSARATPYGESMIPGTGAPHTQNAPPSAPVETAPQAVSVASYSVSSTPTNLHAPIPAPAPAPVPNSVPVLPPAVSRRPTAPARAPRRGSSTTLQATRLRPAASQLTTTDPVAVPQTAVNTIPSIQPQTSESSSVFEPMQTPPVFDPYLPQDGAIPGHPRNPALRNTFTASPGHPETHIPTVHPTNNGSECSDLPSLPTEAVSKLPLPLLGPKGPVKNKKKDLEKWIDGRVDEQGTFPGSLLYKLLRQMVSAEPSAKCESIRRVLQDYRSNLRLETHPVAAPPATDIASLIFRKLATENTDEAVKAALDNRAYSHAMLLVHTLRPQQWQAVVEEFIAEEARRAAAPLAFIYRALAATTVEAGANAISELKPRSETSHLDVSKVDSHLVHWADCVAALLEPLLNASAGPAEAVKELGKLLVERGFLEEGHACFMLSGVPLNSLPQFAFPMVIENGPPGFDSFVLAEVYEFTLGRGSPALLPYKLKFAGLLAEGGFSNIGLKVAETVVQVLKGTKNAPPQLVEAANAMVERCASSVEADAPASGWLQRKLSRPNLEKAWVSSFNKFVSGEDDTEVPPVANGAPQRPLSASASGTGVVNEQYNLDFVPPRQSYTPGPDWRSNSPGLSPAHIRPKSSTTNRPAPVAEVDEEYSGQSPGVPQYQPHMNFGYTQYGETSGQPEYFAEQQMSPQQALQQTSQQQQYPPQHASYTPQQQYPPQQVPPQQYPPQQDHQQFPQSYTPQHFSQQAPPQMAQQQPGQYLPNGNNAYAPFSAPIQSPGGNYSAPSTQPMSSPPPQQYHPQAPQDQPGYPQLMHNQPVQPQAEIRRHPEAQAQAQVEPEPKKEEKPKSKDDGSKKKGWLSWLKKEDNAPKPIEVKLGSSTPMYFDKELGRWVQEGGPKPEPKKGPPPPPKAMGTGNSVPSGTNQAPNAPPGGSLMNNLSGSAPHGLNMPQVNTAPHGTAPTGTGIPGAAPPGTAPPDASLPGPSPPTSTSAPSIPVPTTGGIDGILAAASTTGSRNKRRPARSRYVNATPTGMPEGLP